MSIYEYDEEKHMRMEREQSFADGKAQVNQLILKLSNLGRIDDIAKSAGNPEYQEKLFKEFGL